MRLPILYKRTSTGAIQYWEIGTDGNMIVTRYGLVGGKEQETRDSIIEGKNLGKANATTAIAQAEAEAQAKWTKQVERKGYVASSERAARGETDAEGGIVPMLAHKYSEQGHKIKYPAYAQPKLDGSRCIAVVEDGECLLWSRTRKLITGVPHINRAIEQAYPTGSAIFDGELYNHAYHDKFEQLMSFIRSETSKPGHEIVQYHVYDRPHDSETFSVRMERLPVRSEPIIPVETLYVEDEPALMQAFELFCVQGYEGAIVRNVAGRYVNKRSYDLQKVKEFDDAEYKVVGIEEGRGKLAGHVGSFVCVTEDGTEFRAKAKGETVFLKRCFENASLWRGKTLTVQYQGLTGKNGVPRFPIGLRFR